MGRQKAWDQASQNSRCTTGLSELLLGEALQGPEVLGWPPVSAYGGQSRPAAAATDVQVALLRESIGRSAPMAESMQMVRPEASSFAAAVEQSKVQLRRDDEETSLASTGPVKGRTDGV